MAKRSFLASFSYAAEGIGYALKTQRNMRFHAVAAVMVIAAAALLQLTWQRWLFLLVAITMVMAAELLNTAVEVVVDMVSPEPHPMAKAAKDTAAGAVLLTAIFAFVVAIIVFYQPVAAWLGSQH